MSNDNILLTFCWSVYSSMFAFPEITYFRPTSDFDSYMNTRFSSKLPIRGLLIFYGKSKYHSLKVMPSNFDLENNRVEQRFFRQFCIILSYWICIEQNKTRQQIKKLTSIKILILTMWGVIEGESVLIHPFDLSFFSSLCFYWSLKKCLKPTGIFVA